MIFQRQKELTYEPTYNKLLVYDEQGKSFPSDIYGRKKPLFHVNVSGVASYKERLNAGLVEPLEHEVDNSVYHPQGKYFEGYFQFPRPLSHPFVNLINTAKDKKMVNNLLKQLQQSKRFRLKKSKSLLSLTNNQGLHYMSSSIAVRNSNNKDKESIINKIDNTIKEYKHQDEYGGKQEFSPEAIRALRKFKSKLMNNADNNIHGRLLQKPSMKAQEEFYIMNKIYNVLPLQRLDERNKRNNKLGKNLSMDYILMSKNQKYEDDKLHFISSVGNEDDFGKEKITYIRRTLGEEERLREEMKNRPKEKPKGVFIQHVPPKLPKRGELYQKDCMLLRKVNPIAFQIEDNKNGMDKVFFEKKRKFKIMQNKKYEMNNKKSNKLRNNSVG